MKFSGGVAFRTKYSEEEFETAKKNTSAATRIIEIDRLFEEADADLPSRMTTVDEWDPKGEEFFVVLTQEDCMEGAGVLLCRDILEKIHRKAGDFYIIPSSIHEVILLKKIEALTPERITKWIREINEAETRPRERLADRVMVYDGDLKYA